MATFHFVQIGNENEWATRALDKERCKLKTLREVRLSCRHIPMSAVGDELKASLCE